MAFHARCYYNKSRPENHESLAQLPPPDRLTFGSQAYYKPPPNPIGVENMGSRNLIRRKAQNKSLVRLVAAATIIGLGTSAARTADIAKGGAAFVRQCAICHTIDKGGENRL